MLPVISLLLTNTVSPVRACLSIWVGEVSWDPDYERGPLSIQSYLAFQQTISQSDKLQRHKQIHDSFFGCKAGKKLSFSATYTM